MAGINVSEIVDLGAAAVTINGVNVGHTDENGVKVSVKNEIVMATVGKYGKSPVKHFLNGQTVELEFVLQQSNFANLVEVLPGATKITGSGKDKLTFGVTAGTTIPGVSLSLVPFLTDANQATAFQLAAASAVPVGDWEITYDGKKEQGYKCKFRIQVDELGGTEGNFLFTYGDPTASQDTTAPTVTSLVPVNTSTGISVNTTIVWTLDEDINPSTVNTSNALLFADPTGGFSGGQVAGSVVLVNAGASTTITFTPSAPLTASTLYLAVLSGVEDLAGNALGLIASEFTTA